jgi:hypothetical protein
MLVVVGQERNEVVAVADVGLEKVGPPVEHLSILSRLEDDVSELDR